MAKKIYTIVSEQGFNTIDEYHEYLIDSHSNGQMKQCKELFRAMKRADQKEFLKWLKSSDRINKEEQYDFYFDLL